MNGCAYAGGGWALDGAAMLASRCRPWGGHCLPTRGANGARVRAPKAHAGV